MNALVQRNSIDSINQMVFNIDKAMSKDPATQEVEKQIITHLNKARALLLDFKVPEE